MDERSRIRVLIVTKNFPPYVGGMERLNWHVADELAATMEVRLIGPTGAAAVAPKSVDVREVPIKPLPLFLLAALMRSLRSAITWKPQVVVGGSGLVAPIVWLAARMARARSMLYLHGLDITVPRRLYRMLWLPFMRRVDAIVTNSRSTAQLAEDAGIDATRIGVIHPGVLLPDADSGASDGQIRANVSMGDGPILLSVGRLTKRKGIIPFVGNILPSIAKEYPDVIFAIVGEAPMHSLYAQTQSREAIQNAADAADVGRCVRFLGKVSEQQLIDLYRIADAHVFPVQDLPGDTEGFGMVAIEAAAYGLPTVAFAVGGVADAVADGDSGYLVESNDEQQFAARVLEILSDTQGRSARRARAQAFSKRFSWHNFGAALRDRIERLSDNASR
jgi:phosphatidylinositol alpha-1,6-mannosyltransferase